jgi:hypothetical protein
MPYRFHSLYQICVAVSEATVFEWKHVADHNIQWIDATSKVDAKVVSLLQGLHSVARRATTSAAASSAPLPTQCQVLAQLLDAHFDAKVRVRSLSLYIYIYIYVCVCVCVCWWSVCALLQFGARSDNMKKCGFTDSLAAHLSPGRFQLPRLACGCTSDTSLPLCSLHWEGGEAFAFRLGNESRVCVQLFHGAIPRVGSLCV